MYITDIGEVVSMIPRIGADAFTIWCALNARAAQDGRIDASYPDIARWTGVKAPATISACLKVLIAVELLEKDRNYNAASSFKIISPSKFEIMELVKPNSTTVNKTQESLNRVENQASKNEGLEEMNNSPSNIEGLNKPPPSSFFRDSDANDLICNLTHWTSIPGDIEARKNILGLVIDIHDRHNSDTLEYLRTYWDEFKRRYPRSTKLFWLTDWAVQGVIPDSNKGQQREEKFIDYN